MARLESNIPKLYILVVLRWLLFVMPIIVLFFYENGLTQTQIMILQSIFSIGVVVFEIPSGYFSDVFGRKRTLVIGSIISTIAFGIYSVSTGFWGFLAAELILGLGASCISGTDSAMIYDSLILCNKENEYAKIEGRRTSVANFSETTASILGGLLATISLRFPFYIELGVMACTIPIAMSLVEPERHKFDRTKSNLKNILSIVRFALVEHRQIKWLIIYSSIVGTSTLTMVWFIQPYLDVVGLPVAYFGIVWAALNFSVGLFSMFAYRLERFLGQSKTLLLLLPLSVLAYSLTAFIQSLWVIAVFFIFYFVRGLHGPMLKDYVNRLTSSDKRATVLSVKNMMGRLFFTIIGPFIGWIKDVYSFQWAFLIAAVTFLIVGGGSILFLRKYELV
ncbi:MFS transporter [candidate division KSB1 bacterium]|nr:MFS transporter [candidate division KSB1 bacterium]RQW03439.1 MAG: MFS transporter [candidate division KSB1 bacterium]